MSGEITEKEDEAMMTKITGDLIHLQIEGRDILNWLASDKGNTPATVNKIETYLRALDIKKLGLLGIVAAIRSSYSSRKQIPYWYEFRDQIISELKERKTPNWEKVMVGLKPGDYGMER